MAGSTATKKIPIARTNLYVVVDAADFGWLSEFRWELLTGYAARRETKNYKSKTVLMHREIVGLDAGDLREVDHRNGNGLDNRRSNLVACTHAENQFNRSGGNFSYGGRKPTSQFRGVSLEPDGKWRASVRFEGNLYYLGRFENEEEAAQEAQGFRSSLGRYSRDQEVKEIEARRRAQGGDTALQVARPSRKAKSTRAGRRMG